MSVRQAYTMYHLTFYVHLALLITTINHLFRSNSVLEVISPDTFSIFLKSLSDEYFYFFFGIGKYDNIVAKSGENAIFKIAIVKVFE